MDVFVKRRNEYVIISLFPENIKGFKKRA